MRKTVFILAILLALSTGALAIERGVTPYGDFCPKCTNYGVGKQLVNHVQAVAAMKSYFMKRGMTIGNVHRMGRFMRVDVLRDGEKVDRIIFDRKSGRIRSVY